MATVSPEGTGREENGRPARNCRRFPPGIPTVEERGPVSGGVLCAPRPPRASPRAGGRPRGGTDVARARSSLSFTIPTHARGPAARNEATSARVAARNEATSEREPKSGKSESAESERGSTFHSALSDFPLPDPQPPTLPKRTERGIGKGGMALLAVGGRSERTERGDGDSGEALSATRGGAERTEDRASAPKTNPIPARGVAETNPNPGRSGGLGGPWRSDRGCWMSVGRGAKRSHFGPGPSRDRTNPPFMFDHNAGQPGRVREPGQVHRDGPRPPGRGGGPGWGKPARRTGLRNPRVW
jgi:hypothetical protein